MRDARAKRRGRARLRVRVLTSHCASSARAPAVGHSRRRAPARSQLPHHAWRHKVSPLQRRPNYETLPSRERRQSPGPADRSRCASREMAPMPSSAGPRSRSAAPFAAWDRQNFARETDYRAGDTWHGKFSGAMPMLATMAQRLSRLQKLERTSPRLVSAYAWSCWGYSLTGLWLLYCLPSMPGTCQSTVIMPTRAFALTLVLQARRAGCAASPSAPMPFYIPLRAFSDWISPARVCRRDRAHTRTTRSPRSAGPSLVVTPLGRGSTAPSRGSTS